MAIFKHLKSHILNAPWSDLEINPAFRKLKIINQTNEPDHQPAWQPYFKVQQILNRIRMVEGK
jgi:hypothetical protein